MIVIIIFRNPQLKNKQIEKIVDISPLFYSVCSLKNLNILININFLLIKKIIKYIKYIYFYFMANKTYIKSGDIPTVFNF